MIVISRSARIGKRMSKFFITSYTPFQKMLLFTVQAARLQFESDYYSLRDYSPSLHLALWRTSANDSTVGDFLGSASGLLRPRSPPNWALESNDAFAPEQKWAALPHRMSLGRCGVRVTPQIAIMFLRIGQRRTWFSTTVRSSLLMFRIIARVRWPTVTTDWYVRKESFKDWIAPDNNG